MKASTRRVASRSIGLIAKVSGLTSLLRQRRRQRGDHRIYILEYHEISKGKTGDSEIVPRSRFRKHLELLQEGHVLMTVSQAARALSSNTQLDQDVAVVTFDDGYIGNYLAAWPILQDLGIPATVYLTTGFLDGRQLWFDVARRTLEAASIGGDQLRPATRLLIEKAIPGWRVDTDVEAMMRTLKYTDPEIRESATQRLAEVDLPGRQPAQPMTWDQVRDLTHHGVECGCHTVTHPILSRLPYDQQEEEILVSRERIQSETGHISSTFAFPNGSKKDYNDDTLAILQDHGFSAACTTRKGSNRPGCNLYTLRRIGVGDEPRWVLEARLAGLFDEGIRKRLAVA